MLFSESRSGKANKTKLGRRNYLGHIYNLTKFGADRMVVTFFSHLIFFRFLGQSAGRNFGPICTRNGSKDFFRLIHVPFQGLMPSNSLWGCLRSKNRQICTRKSRHLADFLQKNRFNIRSPESTLWRTPPSWISENVCHFLAIWLINTKLSRNIATLIHRPNTYMESKRLSNQNSPWWSPSWWTCEKKCFYFFTIWPLIAKFNGNVVATIRNTPDIKSALIQYKWHLHPSNWIP